MGLKESLKKLQEDERADKKLSLKREVRKELTKLKNEKILDKKCVVCSNTAKYSIKGSNDWYCKECAVEYFGDLNNLAKLQKKYRKKNKNSETKKSFIKNLQDKKFLNFLKILEVYQLKKIPRNSSNQYYDEKDRVDYRRRETTAEHIYSSLRLADFFLTSEKEFADLNKVKVFELLMYHDDIEIITRDTGISEREARLKKEQQEKEALPILSKKYPKHMDSKILMLDKEYRENKTAESKFANAIDKMDAIVHELQYPEDWGPKGFDEKNVKDWFQHAFEHSPTFMEYFKNVTLYLNKNGYFKK